MKKIDIKTFLTDSGVNIDKCIEYQIKYCEPMSYWHNPTDEHYWVYEHNRGCYQAPKQAESESIVPISVSKDWVIPYDTVDNMQTLLYTLQRIADIFDVDDSVKYLFDIFKEYNSEIKHIEYRNLYHAHNIMLGMISAFNYNDIISYSNGEVGTSKSDDFINRRTQVEYKLKTNRFQWVLSEETLQYLESVEVCEEVLN
jgi:hypothetical protein